LANAGTVNWTGASDLDVANYSGYGYTGGIVNQVPSRPQVMLPHCPRKVRCCKFLFRGPVKTTWAVPA
jgi:hypothetical protein